MFDKLNVKSGSTRGAPGPLRRRRRLRPDPGSANAARRRRSKLCISGAPGSTGRPDSCIQVRRCERCQAGEERNAAHQWDQWEYATGDTCEAIARVASAVMRPRARQGDHQFGPWGLLPHRFLRARLRRCERCGRTATNRPAMSGTRAYEGPNVLATSCISAGGAEPAKLKSAHRDRARTGAPGLPLMATPPNPGAARLPSLPHPGNAGTASA